MRRLIDGPPGRSKLRPMSRFRRRSDEPSVRFSRVLLTLSSRLRIARVLAAAALAGGTACEQRRNVPAVDSTVPLRPAPIGAASATPASTWDTRLGPVLLVAGSSPEAATIVGGDTTRSGADT